jgi:very-short-patch-repair endonuclease
MPIAGYVADFGCPEARLVVELDGGQHASDPSDAGRTAAIEGAGYLVVRFWNHEVMENLEGVLEAIAATIRNARAGVSPRPLTPTLSPPGRGSDHEALRSWLTNCSNK